MKFSLPSSVIRVCVLSFVDKVKSWSHQHCHPEHSEGSPGCHPRPRSGIQGLCRYKQKEKQRHWIPPRHINWIPDYKCWGGIQRIWVRMTEGGSEMCQRISDTHTGMTERDGENVNVRPNPSTSGV